jgi:hypothetical protein
VLDPARLVNDLRQGGFDLVVTARQDQPGVRYPAAIMAALEAGFVATPGTDFIFWRPREIDQ